MSNIGVDIEEISKFKRLIGEIEFKFYSGTLLTVFTKKEIQLCLRKKHPFRHFAVRFAGKEAFLKALGTGLRGDILFSDIEFLSGDEGQPYAKCYGATKKEMVRQKIRKTRVSFSHSRQSAIALVLLES